MFLIYFFVVHQYFRSYYKDLPLSTPLPKKSNQNSKQDTYFLKDKYIGGNFSCQAAGLQDELLILDRFNICVAKNMQENL